MTNKKGYGCFFRTLGYGFLGMLLMNTLVFLVIYRDTGNPSMVVGTIMTFLPIALFLIITGLRDLRASHQWNVRVVSKLAIGIVPTLALITLAVYATIYASACMSRIGATRDLQGCNLSKQDLHGVDLSNARLVSADLTDTNLKGANLAGADLSNAALYNAQLQGANLNGANLTKAKLSGANLTDVTLERTVLDGVRLMGATGLKDAQLIDVLQTTPILLASVLAQKDIRLESRSDIASGLREVCGGKGTTRAADYTSNAAFHPIIALNTQGGASPLLDSMPSAWQPMALRFTELVLCVSEEQEDVVQKCAYNDGQSMTRYQYHIDVQTIAAKTGAVVAKHPLYGQPPSACPATKVVGATSEMHGGHVDLNAVMPWLADFVHPPG